MDRRRFLYSTAALAASTFPACARARSGPGATRESNSRKRIIVIGSGLAGLVAADELGHAGHDVTVLEARPSPGGRVHTLREPFSDGLYAEAGALFIPSNHDLVLRYVRLFGLPLQPAMPFATARLFYVKGQRLPGHGGANAAWPFELTDEERMLGYGGVWDKYIGSAVKALGDVTDLATTTQLAAYDRMTMAEFLRSRGASAGAVEMLRLGYLNATGDGIDTYSAFHMLRDLAQRRPEKQTFAIRGGNDLLTHALAERMPARVRYQTPAVRIEPGNRAASVVVRNGGAYERLTADYVVCAIPFTVLRELDVAPAFSATKREAIATLRYTSVARVYLQSKRRVWQEERPYVSVTTDLPTAWMFDHTVNQPGPRGVLEGQAFGAQARRLTQMTEAERIRMAVRDAEEVFPTLAGHVEASATKCWDADPYARGAFAYLTPGQMTSLLPHIARPEGHVHFAGEHTSRWTGWMQGAIESGLRVAHEITADG